MSNDTKKQVYIQKNQPCRNKIIQKAIPKGNNKSNVKAMQKVNYIRINFIPFYFSNCEPKHVTNPMIHSQVFKIIEKVPLK